jgi:hypothetical protein
MSLDEIIRAAASRAETIRVRNVLNPILWGCAVVTPVCGGLAYLLEGDPVLRYGFSAAAIVPVLLLAVSYLYFMLRDPDRLQSEEFVSRQQDLLLLARKAQPPVPANPEHLAAPASITRTEEDRP